MNGEVSISNLRIGGFSTIHRTGECELTPRPTQDQAEVVVFVGGNDIVIGVDFMWGVGVFKTNLQIELLVRHVDLMIDVILNTETFEVILNNFLLNEIGLVLHVSLFFIIQYNWFEFFNMSRIGPSRLPLEEFPVVGATSFQTGSLFSPIWLRTPLLTPSRKLLDLTLKSWSRVRSSRTFWPMN